MARAGYRTGQSLYISYNPGGGWNDYDKSSEYLNKLLVHRFDGDLLPMTGAESTLVKTLPPKANYPLGDTRIILSFDSITPYGAATVVVRQPGGWPCDGVCCSKWATGAPSLHASASRIHCLSALTLHIRCTSPHKLLITCLLAGQPALPPPAPSTLIPSVCTSFSGVKYQGPGHVDVVAATSGKGCGAEFSPASGTRSLPRHPHCCSHQLETAAEHASSTPIALCGHSTQCRRAQPMPSAGSRARVVRCLRCVDGRTPAGSDAVLTPCCPLHPGWTAVPNQSGYVSGSVNVSCVGHDWPAGLPACMPACSHPVRLLA